MDGTLTTVPSSAFLGQAFGYAAEAEERERRYVEGVMTNHDVAVGDAEHFRGRLKREVWKVLEDLPRVDGIGETVARCHCDEHDKARFVEAYCTDRGIPLAAVAAVGDSRSDLPLFGKVGRAIAFNAVPVARERAHVSLAGGDLRIVLKEILSDG